MVLLPDAADLTMARPHMDAVAAPKRPLADKAHDAEHFRISLKKPAVLFRLAPPLKE